MSERFTDTLRRAADGLWQAQHDHPFVRGIGDGTVDMAAFAYWVRQDYVYLVQYSRVLALAAARAPDLATTSRFAELANVTLNTEMALHRSYAREFGISEGELEAELPSPTTQGYTDFLLRTAALGSFPELCAAILPCMWGFSEIGLRLAQRGVPEEPRCAAWVRMYSDPLFAELASWCRALVDRLADGQPQEELERMRRAFMLSSRYELAFWEMAHNQERWPGSQAIGGGKPWRNRMGS